MIHFFCPHCDSKLTAVGERAGTETICTNCQHAVLVPNSPFQEQGQLPPKPAPTRSAHQASQWSDAYTPSAVPPSQPTYGVPIESQGMAIASLVLGICSLVMFWCVFLGAPLAILAIVFGARGMNTRTGHGMAVAGLVMGAIELGLTALMMILGSMSMTWGPRGWH